MGEDRQKLILEALRAELLRQAAEERQVAPRISGPADGRLLAVDGQIDTIALAVAIDGALGGDALEAGPAPANMAGAAGAGSSPKHARSAAEQGLHPDELDASNDE